MIFGIGTDLCRISRIRRAIGRAHFIEHVFATEEIRYANSAGDPARHFASAYAVKEALAKATGWGVFGLGLRSAWVRRTDTGPVIECDEALGARFMGMGIERIWVSISHEGDFAMAFVVLEGRS